MNRIVLNKPPSGQASTIAISGGRVYTLAFYAANPLWELDEDDATVRFDDGAVLLLRGFVSAALGAGFVLELPGGEMIDAADFVQPLDDIL